MRFLIPSFILSLLFFYCKQSTQREPVSDLTRVEKFYFFSEDTSLTEPSSSFRKAISKMSDWGYFPDDMEYSYFYFDLKNLHHPEIGKKFIKSAWQIRLNRNQENRIDSNSVEFCEYQIDRDKIPEGWNENDGIFSSFLIMYFGKSYFDGDTSNAFHTRNNYYLVNSVTINGKRAILNDSIAGHLSQTLDKIVAQETIK